MSVSYFGQPHLPPSLANIELRYFEQALELIRDRLADPRTPVAVLGQSRGREAALLCGVHFQNLVAAAVASVPANVALGGYPEGGPTWLLDGDPLPWTEETGLDSQEPAASIAVENIDGP